MNENLVGGGRLVRLNSGSLAAEGVPAARPGLVVESVSSHAVVAHRERGCYELTRRVIAGTDLWHLRRAAEEVIP